MRLAIRSGDAVNTARRRAGESATAALSCGVLRVPLVGVVDFAAELRRLDKDLAKVDTDAAFIEKKLDAKDFVRNAPAEVVAKDRRTAARSCARSGRCCRKPRCRVAALGGGGLGVRGPSCSTR